MLDKKIDNQQRRFGWLGGIFDGEGSFCLIKTQEKRNKGFILTPRCQIVNTDYSIIEEVANLLNFNEIGFNIYKRPETKKWRETYRLTISGMKRCVKFLDIINDNLISKKKQVSCLKEFISSRMNRPIKSPYNDFELDVLKRIHVLNQRTNTLNDYTLNIQ